MAEIYCTETSEIWKAVMRCEGEYEISNSGNIRSVDRLLLRKNGQVAYIHSKPLKPFRAGNNQSRKYLQISLRGKNRQERAYIHHLVLEAFTGPCPEGMEACHNDGNSFNNHADNLRWDTKENNHADKKRHGTSGLGVPKPSLRGEGNHKAKLTETDIIEIRRSYAAGEYTQTELGNAYRVGQDTISSIVRKETWRHL